MNLNYLRVTVGDFAENCYILYNDKKEAILIDPGADETRIEKALERHELTPVAVLLTHGHFDHISAADYFRKKYDIKIYVSEDEKAFCESPDMNLSLRLGGIYISLKCDEFFKDGDILPLFDGAIKVIYTPGHTIGGVCFYVESMSRLFSGDTLFLHTVGRWDHPTGDCKALQKSIREKLFVLPEDTAVCPGHGLETVIGHEKMYGTDNFC